MSLWAVFIGALNVKLGFGVWADFLFAIVVAAVGMPLVVVAVALLLAILRRLPGLLSGFFVAVFLLAAELWSGSAGFWLGALILFLECSLGATLATILIERLRQAPLSKRIVTVAIAVLAVAGNVALLSFLHSDGVNEELLQIKSQAPEPPQLKAANPAMPGSYGVKALFYGHADDLRRPEYGHSVAIRTPTVDGSPFLKEVTGWKAWLRRRYWGFGTDKLPLNARVWYPDGDGPFPLVLIVHGNHQMTEFSDGGYAYLGELLASRGFIAASIDENFLNSGMFYDPPKQQSVRGWMLLEHLKLWQSWNATPGNRFYRRVDLQNIALVGHSRGGEAAATAALFNKLSYFPDDATIAFHYGFAIKSVLAIAPADGQYKPAGEWRSLEDINYLTIQGANDADVSSFEGSRQWDHVKFSGREDRFKAELYIYRANHGQFNTAWGRTDKDGPDNWLLNLRPLMSPAEQRQIAKVYMAAFLEATLHDRREYQPLFEDYRRIRAWLPSTLYLNRYLDSSNKTISNFTEDADVTTTTVPGGHLQGEHLTVWREGRIPFRNGDRAYNGVFLGWNNTHDSKSPVPPIATYSISLPPGLAENWKLTAQSTLTLSVAVTDESAPRAGGNKDPEELDDDPEPTDFTVELETGDGVAAKLPVSRFQALLPPLKVRFTKLDLLDKQLYKSDSEPIFQSIILPLGAFAAQDKRFNPARLKTVRLRFDRTPSGVLVVSEIGVGRVGVP